MQTTTNEYLHYLDKVCSDYCMSSNDVYNILISKCDDEFPLSFKTVKYKVLKDVPFDVLENIFTDVELKDIFRGANVKKIKNPQTRKLISALI